MTNPVKSYSVIIAATACWLLLGLVVSRQIEYPQVETITLECVDRKSGVRIAAVSIQYWNRKQPSVFFFEATANNKLYALRVDDSYFYKINDNKDQLGDQQLWHEHSANDAFLPKLKSPAVRPISPTEMQFLFDSIRLIKIRGFDGLASLHTDQSSGTLQFQPSTNHIVQQDQLRIHYRWVVIGTFGLIGFLSTWIIVNRISAHSDAQTPGSVSERGS